MCLANGSRLKTTRPILAAKAFEKFTWRRKYTDWTALTAMFGTRIRSKNGVFAEPAIILNNNPTMFGYHSTLSAAGTNRDKVLMLSFIQPYHILHTDTQDVTSWSFAPISMTSRDIPSQDVKVIVPDEGYDRRIFEFMRLNPEFLDNRAEFTIDTSGDNVGLYAKVYTDAGVLEKGPIKGLFSLVSVRDGIRIWKKRLQNHGNYNWK